MSLNPLSTIKAPDLISFDRETVSREIMDRMRTLPGWQDIFVGEQYQDASQFVIQLFSYLFEKNATATNRIVRENFISEAFSERAVYANLAQMRVSAIQNKEAAVQVTGTIVGTSLTTPLVLPKSLKIPGTGINGASEMFEIIPKSEAGEYQYLESVVIEPTNFLHSSSLAAYTGETKTTTFTTTAYAGETKIISVSIDAWGVENSRISVPYDNIVDGSVMAFYKTSNQIMIPLIKTTKFVVEPVLDPIYFPNGVPHYIVRYTAGGQAIVYFGSASFGGAFESQHVGGSIVVYCRSGGGVNSNINPYAIDISKDVQVGVSTLSINFSNSTSGYGGEDREDFKVAQVFAPLRYGRDGTSVVTDDAKVALYNTVVKHEISTPQYSEIASNIPLLHAWHYIVPKRTPSAWTMPEPIESETLTAYLERAIYDLNIYLGVVGTNDAPVLKEAVTNFVDADINGSYSFLYTMASAGPLSGSLFLTAWDYEDEFVDSVGWSTNYNTSDETTSDIPATHAELETEPFSSVSIYNDSIIGNNSTLKFKLDGIDYIFELHISASTSVNPTAMAASLQASIKSLIPLIADSYAYQYFYQYRLFTFFEARSAGDGTLSSVVLISPSTGKSSKIELVAHGTTPPSGLDLYTMLGIEIGTYRPTAETQLVFSTGSLYYHSTGEVGVLIDKTEMDKSTTFEYTTAWDQPTGVVDGPEITLTLVDENPNKLMKLIPESTLTITAYNGTDPVDSLEWISISTGDTLIVPTVGSGTGVGTIFDDAKIANMSFEYGTSKLIVKLLDGTLATQYKQSFPEITKINIYKVEEVLGVWTPVSPQPWDPTHPTEPLTILEGDFPNGTNYAPWTQDPFSALGSEADIKLTATQKFEASSSYELQIIKTVGAAEVVMNTVRFDLDGDGAYVPPTVISLSQTDGADDWAIDSLTLTPPTYDYEGTGTPLLYYIHLSFNPPTEDTEATAYYNQGFADFDLLIVTFKRKSYEYITAAYRPNPYMPTDEAAEYISILKPTSRRMICLEDIIKNINFAPVGGILTIYIGPGYSEFDVHDIAKQTLLDAYGYDNTNPQHTIGTTVGASEIQATLVRALSLSYGVEEVVFSPSNQYNTLSTAEIASTYFFIPDDSLVQVVKDMEAANSNLTGLSIMFETQINVVARRRT